MSAPQVTGEILVRDKAKIVYDIYGDLNQGVPLVLVTGTSHLKSDWFEFAPILSRSGRGRAVLALDTRGMGDSDLAPGQKAQDLTLTQWAEDVLDVLRALGVTRADLLGWSLGSIVVQHLLCSTPSSEKKVEDIFFSHAVLATSFASPLGLDRPSGSQPTRPPGPSLSMLRSQPMDWATAVATTLYRPRYPLESSLHKTNYERRRKFLAETIAQRPLDIIRAQTRLAAQVDTVSSLACLPKEVQERIALINGHDDMIVPYSQAKLLHETLHFASVICNPAVGDNFGHLWWEFGRGTDWAQQVAGFLDDARRL